MKLQYIPVWTAVLLFGLSLPVFAHGGRGGGGGHRGGGHRGFSGSGSRFIVGGSRGFAGGRFDHRFGGMRFNRFDGGRFHHRFNRGGGGPVYYSTGLWRINGGWSNYPPMAGNYGYSGGYYPPAPAVYGGYAPPPVAEYAPAVVGGDIVLNVQQALRARRFYLGPLDGVSNASTRAAIRAYAAAVGLPSNGAIDANLLASLGLQ